MCLLKDILGTRHLETSLVAILTLLVIQFWQWISQWLIVLGTMAEHIYSRIDGMAQRGSIGNSLTGYLELRTMNGSSADGSHTSLQLYTIFG